MRRRLLLAALAGILVLTAALLIVRARPPAPLAGYVESEPLYLATPVAGSVTRMGVRRGERVAAGQALFAVDPGPIAGQAEEAGGRIAEAEAQAEAARRTAAQFRAAADAARVRSVEADRDAARGRALASKAGTLSEQDAEKLAAAAAAARAELAAAERQAESATAQAVALRGAIVQGQGLSAQARARLGQAAVAAPAAGRIDDVFIRQGAFAAASQPILALLPDDRITVRFFVPEREVSRYRIGRRIAFSCDGCAHGLSARVSYVSPRPEYSPPVIYSRQERARLVFLIEATPAAPASLSPGQLVDVRRIGA